jgi:hypothetical protein
LTQIASGQARNYSCNHPLISLWPVSEPAIQQASVRELINPFAPADAGALDGCLKGSHGENVAYYKLDAEQLLGVKPLQIRYQFLIRVIPMTRP